MAIPAIIALQVIVYALMLSRGGQALETLDGMLRQWGFTGLDKPLGLVTHSWITLGFFTLIVNAFFLAAIGLVVEERIGAVGTFLLYLAGGAGSGLAQWAFSGGLAGEAERAGVLGSGMLAIAGPFGASAAITGAFLVFAPGSLIRMLVMFPVFAVYEIPATWFIAAAVAKDLWLAPGGMDQTLVGSGSGIALGAAIAMLLIVARVVPKQDFDLFHVIRQRRRLAQIRAASTDVENRQTEARRRASGFVPDAVPEGEAALARTEFTDRLAAGDLDGLVAAFRRFAAVTGERPRPSLNRRSHLDAANTLFARGRKLEAGQLYGRFLEDFPADAEASHVKLILAVIHARVAGRTGDAAALVAGLENQLTDADDLEILADLRRELAGSANGSANGPAGG